MSQRIKDIDRTFLDVVEKMAFMFGDPCDGDEVTTYEATWVSASLEFRAGFPGSLALTVPTVMCAEIAANILGLDPEDIANVAIAEDALKEMLNVVAGHVVPALTADAENFDLGVPRITRLDRRRCCELARGEGSACYDFEGTPVILTVDLPGRER